MKCFFKYSVLLVLILCFYNIALPQTRAVDSIRILVKTATIDSNKLLQLNNLAKQFQLIHSYDSAINVANVALNLSTIILANNKSDNKVQVKSAGNRGFVSACGTIGMCYHKQAKYKEAMIYYNKALKIQEEANNKTGIASCLGNIGGSYYQLGDYTKAMDYYLKALAIDEKQKNNDGISRHTGNIGIIYFLQGDYSKALDYYTRALRIKEEQEDKKGVAQWLDAIGGVYHQQGNYPKSLEYYLKSLKIDEELNDSLGMARRMASIAIFYYRQGNKVKSLEYCLKALKIDEEKNNKMGESGILGLMGLIYKDQGNYLLALEYYLKALKLDEEILNQNGIAKHLSNIGNLYLEKAKLQQATGARGSDSLYTKALDYFIKGIKINEELENKGNLTINLGNIGTLYMLLEKNTVAEEYFRRSLSIAKEIGSLDDIKEGHFNLSNLYNKTGNYRKSLEHFKMYTATKDSIFNEEKNNELTRHELNYEFEKKESAAKAEQEKKDAITDAESRKQKSVLILVCCVLCLVFLFAIFIFRSLRTTRKQKFLIEIKNKETEEQKQVIEEKNKDILDSIHYAKRIQLSLLPSERYMARFLNSPSRVKPRD